MNGDIATVIISKEEIATMVKSLGSRISEDFAGKELVLICVLKGGFIFLADLMREITIPVLIDFISVSSYGSSTTSSGIVRIIKDVNIDIKDKHVLLVEDIIDTGLTINYLKELFQTRGPLSVNICTAFDKPSRRKVDVDSKYKGYEIPDKFIVGYGLDFSEKYRNLPEICELKPEVYSRD